LSADVDVDIDVDGDVDVMTSMTSKLEASKSAVLAMLRGVFGCLVRYNGMRANQVSALWKMSYIANCALISLHAVPNSCCGAKILAACKTA
jgi:hypothetical protein